MATAIILAILPGPIAAQDSVYEGEWPPALEEPEADSRDYADETSPEDEPYEDTRQPGIQWLTGPTTGDIGPWAEIDVPAGYRFTGEEDAYAAFEESPAPNPDYELHFEYGYLEPVAPRADWSILFTFDEYGYFPREDGDELDAALIRRYYETGFYFKNEFAASEAEKLRFLGWRIPPRFTPDGGAEWAASYRNGTEGTLVNYVRALPGRSGCLQAISHVPASDFEERLPQLRAIAANIKYKPGQAYSDFREGDPKAYMSLNEYLEDDSWTDERGGLNTVFAWFEKLMTNVQVEWELRSRENTETAETPERSTGGLLALLFDYWYLPLILIGILALFKFDSSRKTKSRRYGRQ